MNCQTAKSIWRATQISFANMRRLIKQSEKHRETCDDCKTLLFKIENEFKLNTK